MALNKTTLLEDLLWCFRAYSTRVSLVTSFLRVTLCYLAHSVLLAPSSLCGGVERLRFQQSVMLQREDESNRFGARPHAAFPAPPHSCVCVQIFNRVHVLLPEGLPLPSVGQAVGDEFFQLLYLQESLYFAFILRECFAGYRILDGKFCFFSFST